MKGKNRSKSELEEKPTTSDKSVSPKGNRKPLPRSDEGSHIDRDPDSPMQDWAETEEDF